MAYEQVGSWAFILGVVIAVIVGLVGAFVALGTAGPWIGLVLVILGFVVGFINISAKELNDFLTAAIALMLVGLASGALSTIDAMILGGFPILSGMVTNIGIFVAPAALIVSLKAVLNLARSPV
jgi:hypothetical protein